MPSTYTPAGIELIANGDQSGTWGETTNDNWGFMESLATGIAAITLSSTSYSLQTSDGVASEGRNLVLVLSGSPGGTCTVTVTPNDMEKVYFVVNGSDQTATFTQGSGGNTSIPAGQSGIIYCDGAGSGAAVSALTTGALVGTTATQTLTNKTLTGFTETVYAISGTTPSISAANGTIQTWTLSGNSTPTDGLSSGQSVTLHIDDGTDYTITWTMVDEWIGGEEPELDTANTTVVELWKVGSSVYGALVGVLA